jgi:hypothetical protein
MPWHTTQLSGNVHPAVKKLQSGTVIPVYFDLFPGISEMIQSFDVVANQTAQRQTDSLYTFYEIAPT